MRITPMDLVVLIITSTVCLAVLVVLIRDWFHPGQADLDLLSQVIMGLVAIVATWIGTRINKKTPD